MAPLGICQMKAYDFLVQAEVGLAQITGAPEEPGRVGLICDIAAGMTRHAAILQAEAWPNRFKWAIELFRFTHCRLDECSLLAA